MCKSYFYASKWTRHASDFMLVSISQYMSSGDARTRLQARMNKGWALTRSGFAIHACMNKGRKKTLRGVILTLVCYACVYVRKTLDSAFALASLGMHVWKRLFKSSARSSSCHAKPARKNKLCTEPFLLRSTCSCEYVLTPANSTSTFLCTKNLRRVSVLHSENVKM